MSTRRELIAGNAGELRFLTMWPLSKKSSEEQLFQVNLRGVISLLSRHIYSSPKVYLRELLQNGRDAIEARRVAEGRESADPTWGIRIVPVSPSSKEFRFIDTGVGLTIDDVGQFLATVGQSSKRDELDVRREGYLGQFGIGLLSCFMISDTITIRSKSALGRPPVEWIGKSDGTYVVRELEGREAARVEIGTEVILKPRPDDAALASQQSVLRSARDFAEFLQVPVRVDVGRSTESINRSPVFTEPFAEPSEELMQLGTELIGSRPLDAIELRVPGSSTVGTAFVLARPTAPGGRNADRVYLGGILVSTESRELLPDWAFFVKCVIMTEGLTPTASREQFVVDSSLEFTRDQLGLAIRRWIVETSATDPIRLADFISVHEFALKTLIVHDDELARTIAPWVSLETSEGRKTVNELLNIGGPIRFAETVDEFRQVVGVSRRDRVVVNAGYANDAEILRKLPSLFEGAAVERIRVTDELDDLDEPPAADAAAAALLEKRATASLSSVGIDVIARAFAPDDLPALYIADTEMLRSVQRGSAMDVATGIWGGVIGSIEAHVAAERLSSGAGTPARLCLNWTNPLVSTLVRLSDDLVFDRTVRLLYIQALLAAQRSMTSADRRLLTTSLTDLVHLSISHADDISSDPMGSS